MGVKYLSDYTPGEGGTIARIVGEGTLQQRLMEMGVLEGTSLEVVRVAPLGDPMEIEIRGYKLSLRKSEASCVEMEA